jgi:hypothetical protein
MFQSMLHSILCTCTHVTTQGIMVDRWNDNYISMNSYNVHSLQNLQT